MTTAIFPELGGQKLTQLWAFDQDNFPHSTGNSLLAGALAWEFEDAVLMFSSPLRHLHCAQGSVLGNESGGLCDVGFRVTLLDTESADAWLSNYTGCTTVDATHWRRLIGQRLNDIRVTPDNANHQQRWRMELTFSEEVKPCSVMYRSDLDGLIETSWGERFELQQIEVNSSKQAFGWLHPAAPLAFILDEQLWRSAQMSDWPFAVRKQLQVSERPQEFYRYTFIKALVARFEQNPIYRQRLQALQYPVKVKDVPQDIYPQVRHALGI
ncbi:hypothetical protein [Limnohabitans sp.]|uniref:hypothetical protein n=1 Tax=Limnohabitans sp. TaxID=1907725 RepID=UPI00286ED8E1|nr:hypothetical protein [Limnohabitans sp.]